LQTTHAQYFLLAISIKELGQHISLVEYRIILKYFLMIILFPIVEVWFICILFPIVEVWFICYMQNVSCATIHNQFTASDNKKYRSHKDCLSEIHSNFHTSSFDLMSKNVAKYHLRMCK
jgi:hypothetical protein